MAADIKSIVNSVVAFIFIARFDEIVYSSAFSRGLKHRYETTLFVVEYWLSDVSTVIEKPEESPARHSWFVFLETFQIVFHIPLLVTIASGIVFGIRQTQAGCV
eukprot:CAMPEP_0184294682 /NCGR_PEP_ID=MMETSP1049-20130417/5812_1 /TAXON_ID=77928 /ORGANISM="Proteomonas sulcata, Strain CCMP704" /LENGTH=103 /DNA_ID=CAMNT_0026603045 /DNA_START=240 /DNA_END=551 /DNA_ORIENTATION=-